MGTHENDPTGAEHFTLHAGIALDDVRKDAAGLEALRAAAVAFLASLPVAAPETWPQRTADGRGMVWACCVSSVGPVCGHRGRILPENWADMGSSERDLWEDRQARQAAKRHASDVAPLPMVAHWATT